MVSITLRLPCPTEQRYKAGPTTSLSSGWSMLVSFSKTAVHPCSFVILMETRSGGSHTEPQIVWATLADADSLDSMMPGCAGRLRQWQSRDDEKQDDKDG